MKAEVKASAKKIFTDNSKILVLHVNPKGEFFTNENLAANSVKDKKSIQKIERSTILTEEKAPAPAPKVEFVCPTLDELKKKEDLPAYLNGLKRADLTDVGKLVKIKLNSKEKNVDFGKRILEAIQK